MLDWLFGSEKRRWEALENCGPHDVYLGINKSEGLVVLNVSRADTILMLPHQARGLALGLNDLADFLEELNDQSKKS